MRYRLQVVNLTVICKYRDHWKELVNSEIKEWPENIYIYNGVLRVANMSNKFIFCLIMISIERILLFGMNSQFKFVALMYQSSQSSISSISRLWSARFTLNVLLILFQQYTREIR